MSDSENVNDEKVIENMDENLEFKPENGPAVTGANEARHEDDPGRIDEIHSVTVTVVSEDGHMETRLWNLDGFTQSHSFDEDSDDFLSTLKTQVNTVSGGHAIPAIVVVPSVVHDGSIASDDFDPVEMTSSLWPHNVLFASSDDAVAEACWEAKGKQASTKSEALQWSKSSRLTEIGVHTEQISMSMVNNASLLDGLSLPKTSYESQSLTTLPDADEQSQRFWIWRIGGTLENMLDNTSSDIVVAALYAYADNNVDPAWLPDSIRSKYDDGVVSLLYGDELTETVQLGGAIILAKAIYDKDALFYEDLIAMENSQIDNEFGVNDDFMDNNTNDNDVYSDSDSDSATNSVNEAA